MSKKKNNTAKTYTEIVDIFIKPDEGEDIGPFKDIAAAQDYLLEKLHMFGKIFVTYKDTTIYTKEYRGEQK